jgi:phospholipid transport system transporter-binding protein
VTLTETRPGYWLLAGELTFATATDAWLPMLDCLNQPTVQLDVSALSRVDSAGLATLVAWLAEAGRQQRTVQVLGASAQLLQLARVGGVDGILPLHWQADSPERATNMDAVDSRIPFTGTTPA